MKPFLVFLALLTSSHSHHHMKSNLFFHKLYNFSEKMNENEKQLFLAVFNRFKHSPILNTQGLSGEKMG
jgi:hypothetical protein